MENKKLTDNEIIKALEICGGVIKGGSCIDCPRYHLKDGAFGCAVALFKYSLDIINRQKAEIERLERRNAELQTELNAMRKAANFNKTEIDRLQRLGVSATRRMVTAKSEAIKEFEERLKGIFDRNAADYVYYVIVDDVAKEMESGDNGFGSSGR